MTDTTESGAAPLGDGAEAAAAAPGPSGEALVAEVQRCKGVLDGKDSLEEDMLAALSSLRKMGALPTKVLSETMIGKTVNTIAKGGRGEAVSGKAREVVEAWRQEHRKRKAASEVGQPPELKRGKSSTLSLGSEAPLPASQEASPKALRRTASGEAPPSMTRTDSLMSVDSLAAASQDDTPSQEGAIAPYRQKVRQKLLEALGQAETIEAKDGTEGGISEMRDPVKLADEIDQALHGAFPKKEDYMAHARSVLFNLKDKKNQSFKFKLMVGFFSPSKVPTLTAEDMASDEKNEERSKLRKFAMEEMNLDWAKKDMLFTGMFTCGKCKGTKTTYFQLQTRSSDEPMTTFVTCMSCNNRWKFC